MKSKAFRHSIEYHGVRAALAMAGTLPRWASLRLGATLGSIAFDGMRIRRDVSVANIVRALGVSEPEGVDIARRSYRNMGRALMEFSAFARWTKADIEDLVATEGMEHFDVARRAGKGVVFVTAHYGTWELVGPVMATRGLPVDYLVGEQSNGRVDDVMNDLRRAQGMGILTRTMALKKLARSLAANRIVCMLADQDAGRSGIMVDFLGQPSSTVRGPAMFAVRFGAPIITGFVHREGGRLRMGVNPPAFAPDLPQDAAIRVLTQHHTDALTTQIRTKPDEYFWPHRRWKTKEVQSSNSQPVTGNS
jgi:Kdo2-lipid IVA lauroyltransferase/acyltransferase